LGGCGGFGAVDSFSRLTGTKFEKEGRVLGENYGFFFCGKILVGSRIFVAYMLCDLDEDLDDWDWDDPFVLMERSECSDSFDSSDCLVITDPRLTRYDSSPELKSSA